MAHGARTEPPATRSAGARAAPPPTALAPLDAALAARLGVLDMTALRLDYWRRDEFAVLEDILPVEVVARLRAEVLSLEPRVKRKSIWGYKSAGSLALPVLKTHAPEIVALYRSPVLIDLLSRLSELPLQICPDDDPHAAAVYWYDRAGDRIGFHYDTSHYRGARFTVLIGLEDDSTARLQCRLHTRERRRPQERIDVHMSPGRLVFFNGDKLLHGVSPLQPNQRRIVLSLQYVSDPSMTPWRRALSTVKDSLTYFGSDAFR